MMSGPVRTDPTRILGKTAILYSVNRLKEIQLEPIGSDENQIINRWIARLDQLNRWIARWTVQSPSRFSKIRLFVVRIPVRLFVISIIYIYILLTKKKIDLKYCSYDKLKLKEGKVQPDREKWSPASHRTSTQEQVAWPWKHKIQNHNCTRKRITHYLQDPSQ